MNITGHTTIYKYKVPLHGGRVEMPAGARILSTAFQGTDLFVWALIDGNCPNVWRRIVVIGTGWPLDEVLEHHEIAKLGEFIGTAHDVNGLVAHVFSGGN